MRHLNVLSRALASLTALALFTAACGGGAAQPTAAPAATAAPTKPAAAPAASPAASPTAPAVAHRRPRVGPRDLERERTGQLPGHGQAVRGPDRRDGRLRGHP